MLQVKRLPTQLSSNPVAPATCMLHRAAVVQNSHQLHGLVARGCDTVLITIYAQGAVGRVDLSEPLVQIDRARLRPVSKRIVFSARDVSRQPDFLQLPGRGINMDGFAFASISRCSSLGGLIGFSFAHCVSHWAGASSNLLAKPSWCSASRPGQRFRCCTRATSCRSEVWPNSTVSVRSRAPV